MVAEPPSWRAMRSRGRCLTCKVELFLYIVTLLVKVVGHNNLYGTAHDLNIRIIMV